MFRVSDLIQFLWFQCGGIGVLFDICASIFEQSLFV